MLSTVQDVFQPILGLISCARMTGRWGVLSHAQNTRIRVAINCVYSCTAQRTAAQRDGALEELLPAVWIRPAT